MVIYKIYMFKEEYGMKKIFIVFFMVALLLCGCNSRGEVGAYECVPDVPFESITITGQMGKENKKIEMILPVGWNYYKIDADGVIVYSEKVKNVSGYTELEDYFFLDPYMIEFVPVNLPDSNNKELHNMINNLMNGNPEEYIIYSEENAKNYEEVRDYTIEIKYYNSDNGNIIVYIDEVYYGVEEPFKKDFKYHYVKCYRNDIYNYCLKTAINDNLSENSGEYALWIIDSVIIKE